MKAHIEHIWYRKTVAVWLVEGGMLLQLLQQPSSPSEAAAWVELNKQEKQQPTFELPEKALEALLEAAGDYLPPSSAQSKHLDDAIEVRDRLLNLLDLGAARLAK